MTEDGSPHILRLLRPADYVTLLNGLLGLAAIVAAVQREAHWAYALVLLAVLVDGLDGAVARATGAGPLGGVLDTLSDLVSFVVAPGVLVYTEYFDREILPVFPLPEAVGPGLWTNGGVLLVAAAFVVAGMLRLARFEAAGGGARHDVFLGLSTPGGALVVVAVALLGRVWDFTWLPAVGLGLVLVAGLLMVSRRTLPKLRGPLAAPSVAVILVALAVGPAFGGLGPVLILAFSLTYVAFGPAYARGRARSVAG